MRRRSLSWTVLLLLVLPAVAVGVQASHGADPTYLNILGASSTTAVEPLRELVHPAVPFRGPLSVLATVTPYDGVGAAEVDLRFHQGKNFHARVLSDTPDDAAKITVAFYTPDGREPGCVGFEEESHLCYGPAHEVQGEVETTRALVWLWDAAHAEVCFSVHSGPLSNCR